MSALGFRIARAMSALPLKADIGLTGRRDVVLGQSATNRHFEWWETLRDHNFVIVRIRFALFK
jgi:hypothetical protein